MVTQITYFVISCIADVKKQTTDDLCIILNLFLVSGVIAFSLFSELFSSFISENIFPPSSTGSF